MPPQLPDPDWILIPAASTPEEVEETEDRTRSHDEHDNLMASGQEAPPAPSHDWHSFIVSEMESWDSYARTISEIIHKNPEQPGQEHRAHYELTTRLRVFDCAITACAHGLRTAFIADEGSGGRLVVFAAQYHSVSKGVASGHNLTAVASWAAFLGVASALRESKIPGRVRLVGIPGDGSGRKLFEEGVYEGADSCFMVVPGPGYRLGGARGVTYMRMMGYIRARVTFISAAVCEEFQDWDQGVDALDAGCLFYNTLSVILRQIKPHERIHASFGDVGGATENIPSRFSAEYIVRSDSVPQMEALFDKVQRSCEAAALATGCAVQVERLDECADLRPSHALCRAYVEAMPGGAVSYQAPDDFIPPAADVNRLSYQCPMFVGGLAVESGKGERHGTEGFTEGAGSAKAYLRAVQAARAMAGLAWRVLTDDAFARRVRREWEVDMEKVGC